MRTYPYYLISNADIATTAASTGHVSSSALKIDYTLGFAIQNTFTGTPLGINSIYFSNDGVTFQLVNQVQVGPNATSGSFMWSRNWANCEYVKVDFLSTSSNSSGTWTSLFQSKGA